MYHIQLIDDEARRLYHEGEIGTLLIRVAMSGVYDSSKWHILKLIELCQQADVIPLDFTLLRQIGCFSHRVDILQVLKSEFFVVLDREQNNVTEGYIRSKLSTVCVENGQKKLSTGQRFSTYIYFINNINNKYLKYINKTLKGGVGENFKNFSDPVVDNARDEDFSVNPVCEQEICDEAQIAKETSESDDCADKPKKSAKIVSAVKTSDIQEIFHYWQEKFKRPKAKLSEKRRKKIESALSGYGYDVVIDAIDGCANSPFHMGQNDRGMVYDDIELILRDEQKIENFCKLASGSLMPESKPPKQRRYTTLSERNDEAFAEHMSRLREVESKGEKDAINGFWNILPDAKGIVGGNGF